MTLRASVRGESAWQWLPSLPQPLKHKP